MHPFPRPFLCLIVLVLSLAVVRQAKAQVYISEILADNQVNSLVDEDADHSDWMELWNSGASAVSLNGWYLTDNSGDLHKWRFPVATPAVTLAAGGRLIVWASNKDRRLAVNKLHTNFRLSKSAGSFLALVQADGLTIAHSFTYPQQVQDIAYGIVAQTQYQILVAPGADGKAKVPLSAADMPVSAPVNASDWRHQDFNDGAWQAGQTGFGYDTLNAYGSLIGPGGDLQAAMNGINSTALIRIPFNVTAPASIAALRLSMKYDDGFNCYLNGNLIQSSSSGGTAWNAAALADRNGSFTPNYTVFNPATAHTFLVAGTNVLAFQLLNNNLNNLSPDVDVNGVPNGSRTLCLPLLEGNVILSLGAPTYLTSATPNAANSSARTTVGPGISQTTDQPSRPTGNATSAPIVVSAKVTPTLRPLKAVDPVQLKYKVMYTVSELTVPMRDDGLAPDAVSGDGIFTGQIPTVSVGIAKMIRWRVTATDNNTPAATSADPPYLDTADNEQYFGTVTQDGITTSQLPILHWFVENTAASRTDGGTRCSLFYLDRFYDNVFVGLHGQSSSGFPPDKKSHDFNFNEDNRFKWKEGEARQRAVNLITTWADKSHVRDTVAWESWQQAQHLAGHWANLVRVQQNGAFWGLYDMVENGDEDFVKRAGLDPYGALYKCYNSLEDTTNVEKKTRDAEAGNYSDLQALINALNPATKSLPQRRQYSYDNVDVPSLVNYLAANVLILNNDFGHKNYYVYRDTNGTREWSVLPWDQDLSLGHTWNSSPNYFDDDIHSQAGLFVGAGLVLGAANGNRLMNLIMNTDSTTMAPEMVRMFLRRLRTLMDKSLISAVSTTGYFETRFTQLIDLMDPPGAAYLTDADLDLRKWGYWTDGNNGNVISPNNAFDAATHDQGPRKQTMRLIDSNPTPPNPSSISNSGLGNTNTTFPFLVGRRQYLYASNPTMLGVPIPAAQAAAPTGLVFEYVEANPSSGNQGHEFFIIRNNSASYVDISGWKITGAVDYTFRGGTVIPPFTSGSAVTATGDVHAGRLHVARDPYLFRQRTTSPRGGEYRLVTGPYSGQLSARGETLNLVIPGATPAQDIVVATTIYLAAPTPAQNFLRVTELSYNPAAPTAAELLALPGVQASDFEFIEVMNIDVAPLNIGGARFDKGVTFTFPANFTLQPGERCVVVALTAAYNLRYSGSGALVAGQFEGNLSDRGETIQLLDAVGESVLKFDYDPLWFGVPMVGNPSTIVPLTGYSLVTRTSSPAWNTYDSPTTWALADTLGGTPGTALGDEPFANVFLGWRKNYFTKTEETLAISSPSIDADSDGRSNFEEFAFGGNPRAFESKPQATTSIVTDLGTEYLAVTFERRHHALDTTYVVQASPDLIVWTTLTLPPVTVTNLGNGMERVTYRDDQAIGSGPRFLRVHATR